MSVQIAKGAGCIQIGNSDYPMNSFRAYYLEDRVELIVVKRNLINAPKLTFRYADLVDDTDTPLGSDMETVRPKLQAILYSAPAEEPAAPDDEPAA